MREAQRHGTEAAAGAACERVEILAGATRGGGVYRTFHWRRSTAVGLPSGSLRPSCLRLTVPSRQEVGAVSWTINRCQPARTRGFLFVVQWLALNIARLPNNLSPGRHRLIQTTSGPSHVEAVSLHPAKFQVLTSMNTDRHS
jgi:hypothetical protein